ncbi:MAG: winged helix-turn-helix domain-containing protein [Alphaproteobacteria bacterium]|nr:winged helix-turn-helix domain-containing protein [Alphaproteobacteria bacterium]
MQAAYRAERESVRRSHLQVIWLLLSGDPASEVARVTGFTGRWIEKLIDRWNRAGMAGLGDRRRHNAGAAPLLDAAGLAALAAVLERPPADGGLWNGRQVANWMSGYLGREVSPKRGLDYLHRLDFSLQRPRPRHAAAAGPEERQAFKKNSRKRWRRRGGKHPSGRSRSGPSTSTASA